MAIIVPQQVGAGPLPATSPANPAFRLRFLNSSTVVDLSFNQMAASTSIGRTNNRTDGAASGSANLTLDDTARNLDPDYAASPLNGLLLPGGTTTVVLDCLVPDVGYFALFTGLIEDIGSAWPNDPIWSQASLQLADSKRDLTQHIPAYNVIYPYQQTGARIAALVGAPSRSGWGWINRAPSGAFAIDAGQKCVGELITDGSTDTWTYISDTAAAEEGLVFFDQNGILTFQCQSHRTRQTTPLWVFGEDSGELHYENTITFDLPNDRVIADVAYDTADGFTEGYGPNGAFSWQTATSGATGPSSPAIKQTTKAQATSTTTPLADQYSGASRSRSEWRRFSVNRRDIPTLEIDAFADWSTVSSQSASNRAWCALTARVGDLVTVNRRPPGGTITKTAYIDAITHTIGPGSWKTQLYLVEKSATVGGWNLGTDKLGAIQLAW